MNRKMLPSLGHGAVLLACGIGVSLGSGCNSEPPPITSQTSKYEVAESAEPAANSPAAAPTTSPDASGALATSPAARPAATPPTNTTPPNKPSSTPPRSVESPADGQAQPPADPTNPQQMLDYLTQLREQQPRGTTQEEALAKFKSTQNEIVRVAESLMNLPVDGPTKQRAAEDKIRALTILVQLQSPEANQELQIFLAALAKSEQPELARLGKRMAFAQKMDAFASGDETDASKLLVDFQDLFQQGDKDKTLFILSNQVAQLFMQLGKNTEAVAVMQLAHDSFKDHADEQVARQAQSMGEEIKMVKLDINGKLQAYFQDGPDGEKNLLAAMDELLSAQDSGVASLQVALQVATMLEARSFDTAAHIYDQVMNSYGKHPNADVAKVAKSSFENFGKRKALIGEPFEIQGNMLDGAPFDWSKYQGKVVLVDFWATWCGPCLQEIPNIRKNYEQYKEQGFEVVGVNLDDNPADVQKFFSVQQLPWTTVVSADPNQVGFENPLAAKCGIEAIPFLVLVGRDGKTIALNVRGEALGEKLAELFGGGGPAATPATPAKKTSRFQPHLGGKDWLVALADDRQAIGAESNPYSPPPGLSTAELVEFILDMQEKPQSIQKREGFAQGVAEAADQVLAGESSEKQQRIAIQAMFDVLHRAARDGDGDADKRLVELARRFQNDKREEVGRIVQFLSAEQAALGAAELEPEKIPAVLDSSLKYLEQQKLAAEHVRMASGLIEAVNRLPEDVRENYFLQFGKLFAASSDRELARYGARIAAQPRVAMQELIGKPLELTGTTVLGQTFDWASYRGKVVVVDFWATWCGPCRAAMPNLQATYDRLSPQGLTVVGVSVDKDLAELEKFLGENKLPWTNLAGQDATDTARRLGIRAIPTMMLVDTDGRVVAVGHKIDELTEQAEKLLANISKG